MNPGGAYAIFMRISFSTGTYYHQPLRFSLELAQDLGFDGVEWVVSLGYMLDGLGSIQEAFQSTGVRALSVHPPFYPFPGWPRHPARASARLGALARHLGAELFVVHAALFNSFQSRRADLFGDSLERGKLASGPRIVIGVETGQHVGKRRRRYLLDDLPTLVSFCQRHGCGITFDTCHAGANGEDLLECYRTIKPVLRNVHLSDVTWRGGEPRTHRLPGEGTLALGAFLETLARDGYDGLVTLEVHPLQAGPLGRAQAARRLSKALDFVRAYTSLPRRETAEQRLGDAASLSEERDAPHAP